MHPLYQLPKQSKGRLQAWKKLVRTYEQSDVSMSKFCEDQGINIKTFTKWKIKFDRGEQNTFIPVKVEIPEESMGISIYEISHKNGFSLKCDDQANIKTVIQLLKAIGGVV